MTIYQMNDGRFVIKGEGWSDRNMHVIKTHIAPLLWG